MLVKLPGSGGRDRQRACRPAYACKSSVHEGFLSWTNLFFPFVRPAVLSQFVSPSQWATLSFLYADNEIHVPKRSGVVTW